MTSSKVEDKNYIKLAQIYNILKNEHDDPFILPGQKEIYITAILNSDFNTNYKLPLNCFITLNNPQYLGNTVLHFVIEFYKQMESKNHLYDICLDLLIKYDADLTIQNESGHTPLLLAFTKGKKIFHKILYHHRIVRDFTNSRCKNGMSHFHAICSTNFIDLIDYFLKNGVDVNECVHDNSPKFAGYTPLHFAVQYCQSQTIELLLNNGASLNIKDANGVTPLHLLINNLIQHNISRDDKIWKILQNALCNNLFNLPDNVGLTYTHLNCSLGNFKSIEQNLDIHTPINLNSIFYPGYTPLHFAAHCNFETVILLLEAGANLLIQDCYGVTPLDICAKNFTLDDIFKIISTEKQHQLSKLKFKNGASVLDTLPAMSKYDKFEQYLKDMFGNINTFVPFELPIWPGCTLLHIAVKLNGPVSIILSRGASLTIQDANGMSPLHIAFRMMKVETVSTILDFHMSNPVNPVDRNNLSHLHMACAARNYIVAQCLLENGADPNLPTLCDFQWKLSEDCNLIQTGSTPVHIAIHHLCTKNDDFDATVHLSRMINCNFLNILQKHRANFNLADKNGVTPYHIALKYEREKIFNWMLKSDQEFDREKRYEKLGLTRLQMACFIQDRSIIKQELESGAKVNNQISLDSPIWPGDTALHILYRKQFKSRDNFVDMLLVHGADPSLRNASNSTPIHLSKGEIFQSPMFYPEDSFYVKNPVNNQGQSHFHMSCMSDNLFVAKNFLKSGVNINTPIDYFADQDAGYTPLHYAVKHENSDLIDLLLNYGADPNIKAVNGLTPLHLAVSLNFSDQVDILLRYSTLNIQATNILGKTALEMALECNPLNKDLLKILFDTGASIIEFLKIIISRRFGEFIFTAVSKLTNRNFVRLISKVPDVTVSDGRGHNAIHYLALSNINDVDFTTFYSNMKILLSRGCEIDHKDNKGKTPLHLAAALENLRVIEVLVALGADINIKDDDKYVPYAYISSNDCKLIFIQQVLKLEAVGLHIDKFNEMDFYHRQFYFNNTSHEDIPYCEEDLSKIYKDKRKLDLRLKKETNPTLSVAYIFSEKFLKDCWKISQSRQLEILKLCKPFLGLSPLINVQFKRGQMRCRLLQPAVNSFQMLTGITIPEMCFNIINYLDIDSLMNLVRAAHEKLVYTPLIEKKYKSNK